MQFNQFKNSLRNFIVFSIKDIRKIFPDFHSQRLSEWQKKGYLKKIIAGFYFFTDLPLNEQALFLIANRLHSPSYISLQSALNYYDLIPEGVFSLTSVSSHKNQTFQTPLGYFSYQKIKPSLMFGYQLINLQNQHFKIADPEKTILDFFYLNPKINNPKDFEELRINKEIFREKIQEKKLKQYLEIFQNLSLEKRINNFLKFIHHA